jgi:hypothetical protein
MIGYLMTLLYREKGEPRPWLPGPVSDAWLAEARRRADE